MSCAIRHLPKGLQEVPWGGEGDRKENQNIKKDGYSDEGVRPWASAYLVSSAVVWRPSCTINLDL